MKRNLKKTEEKERARRLTLHRETIQILDDPLLLALARGGTVARDPSGTTTEGTGCQ